MGSPVSVVVAKIVMHKHRGTCPGNLQTNNTTPLTLALSILSQPYTKRPISFKWLGGSSVDCKNMASKMLEVCLLYSLVGILYPGDSNVRQS